LVKAGMVKELTGLRVVVVRVVKDCPLTTAATAERRTRRNILSKNFSNF
jgi:hypothetical protein